MCRKNVVHLMIDTEMSPVERGIIDYGRKVGLSDCPYDDPDNISKWISGREKAIRRVIRAKAA